MKLKDALNTMKYAGLIENDFTNGEGVCTALFLQGCPFRCKGCHNPDTWDFEGGIEIEEETLIQNIIKAICANGIQRNLSILGGEPLCAQNLNFTKLLITRIKQIYPTIKINIWTGIEFSHLQQNLNEYSEILSQADLLVTGRFILELRDITLPLRGSSNQEIWRRNNGWHIDKN